MPTYTALGTNVKLVTTSLADTTTAKPERKKGAFSTEEAYKAETLFKQGRQLSESHIPCLGEHTRLHFLGDVPFYLIQAGVDLFKPRDPTVAECVKALLERRKANSLANGPEIPPLADGHAPSSAPVDGHSTPATNDLEDEDEHSHHVAILESLSRSRRQSRALGGATRSSGLRRASGVSNNNSTPQALGLVISLTLESFARTFDKDTARQSVKIELYFNGDLAASHVVMSRYAVNPKDQKAKDNEERMVQVFSGNRVERLAERPWVILPPSQNADGSLREIKRSKASQADASERWRQLSVALSQQADTQGFNEHGERTPVGAYLADLASFEMPEAVKAMQKPGGHKLGIIDVIIAVGVGQKGSASSYYLSEPERLTDPRFKPRVDVPKPPEDLKSTQTGPFVAPTNAQTAPTSNAHILAPFPSVPEIDFNDAIVTTPTRDEAKRMSRSIIPASSQLSSSKVFASSSEGSRHHQNHANGTSIDQTSNILAGSEVSPDMPPPQTPLPATRRQLRRRRSDAIKLSDDGSTPTNPSSSARPGSSSGSKSVSGYLGMTKRGIFNAESKVQNGTGSPQFRTGANNTIAKKDGDNHETEIKLTRVVVKCMDKVFMDRVLSRPYILRPESKTVQLPPNSLSPFQPLDESVVFSLGNCDTNNRMLPPPAPLTFSFQPPTPATSSPFVRPPRRTPAVGVPSHVARPIPKFNEAIVSRPRSEIDLLNETKAMWKTPELSKDCVIGFAEEGPWLTAAGKGSVLRQIRSQRPGEFRESEVLFAVRYIIAGEAGAVI